MVVEKFRIRDWKCLERRVVIDDLMISHDELFRLIYNESLQFPDLPFST